MNISGVKIGNTAKVQENVNAFEKMKMGRNQETQQKAKDPDNAFHVSISEEGAKSYRESLQKEGCNTQKTEDREKLKEILSKSVIELEGTTEADFHSRFTKMNTQTDKEDRGADKLSENLLTTYTQIYDEIKRGYADGTREIWIADPSAELGYRQATEEEELAALDKAMDFHAMTLDAYLNEGIEGGRKAREAVERTWAKIENQRYVNQSHEEKEDRTENIRRKLMKAADSIKEQYTTFSDNLPSLVGKTMLELFKRNSFRY